MEVIWDALIWIMSWVVDRRLHSEQAFRLLFLIAFSVFATLLALYWKDLAYRSSAIRRRLLPGERFAGRYLQAVWRNGEVRYSFVNIFYNARRRRYEAAGRTYSAAGEKLNDFNSTYVLFPSGKDVDIEFIWRSRNALRGYTRMTLEDSNEDYIQGDGLVITFNAWPRAYPVRFKHLHDHYVRKALGVRSPTSSSEEPDFVRKFHAAFGAHVMEGFGGAAKAEAKAEAQPLEESTLITQS
jgi:hypothetical protein